MRDVDQNGDFWYEYNDNDRLETENAVHEEQPIETSIVQRQRRNAGKAMEIDDQPQLRNSDLAQWNSDYVQNMIVASRLKNNNKVITIAKKNAAFWVFGIGIASVGMGIGESGVPHPLEVFSGDHLMEALTGKPQSPRRKRGRPRIGADTAEEGRNVRPRLDEPEVARGADDDVDYAGDVFYNVRFKSRDRAVRSREFY
jgi:hypothetical protein